MRRPPVFAFTLAITLAIVGLVAAPVAAQDPPPRIGPFVVDLRGSLPRFPDAPLLAASRGLDVRELPGGGLGVDAGAHVYLLKWKALTLGIGGELVLGRSHSSPAAAEGQPPLRRVTERFTSIAPQMSFNFGNGDGWSYLSGGIGRATWSVVPDGARAQPADEEGLSTFNYGGGARWFIKRHLAFTFDVRFHVLHAGTPQAALPGSPRTKLLIISAGISLK